MPHLVIPVVAVMAFITATTVVSPAATQGTPALTTRFDSTKDTIFARIQAAVPTRMHRGVLELSIAPAADDTTLFTLVDAFAVDRAGRFWVFDRPSATIFLFGADGKLIRRIGRRGFGPGEMQRSNGGAALLGDRYAMWDPVTARINWFSSEGAFERSSTLPRGWQAFRSVSTDKSGALFVALPLSKEPARLFSSRGLVRVRTDGVLADSLAPPDLRVPDPYYYVAGTSRNGLPEATYASSFAVGTGWVWHADGFFASIDQLRGRIVFSRRSGKPIVIERALPPVRLVAGERRDEEASITWGMRRADPAWKWTGPPVPETKPALGGLFAARDGRMWIQVALAGEQIPEAELPGRQPNGPPIRRFRSPVAWEVFAADGSFLARVALPPDVTFMEADGNTVWALGRDEDDLPALRRYRVEPPLPVVGGK